MHTIFTVLMSLFMVNVAPDYVFISREATGKETVLEEKQGFSLRYAEHYVLCSSDDAWRRDLNITDNYQFCVFNDHCGIFYYHEGFLYLAEYDRNGQNCYDDKIIANPVDKNWYVYGKDDLYIVGGVSLYEDDQFAEAAQGKELGKTDAFIVRIHNYRIAGIGIFGGTNSEEFRVATASDDRLYLAGHKQADGGGDFGNGGRFNMSVFVAVFDFDLNIITYRVLASADNIVAYNYFKDRLYLVLETRVYKFDRDLDTLYREDYEEKIMSSYMSDILNVLALFTAREAHVYNTYTLMKEGVFSLPETGRINILENSVLIRGNECAYEVDIACLQYFHPPEFYCPDVCLPLDVLTLFGPAILTDESYQPLFDAGVFGKYEKTYEYISAGGINFHIDGATEVRFESNVFDGGIYPIGYRLSFTGIALLNGKNILNNYRLDQAGEYHLELAGNNGIKKNIIFTVAYEQINFSEHSASIWDVEAEPGTFYYLDFSYDTKGDFSVIGLIMDGAETDDLLVDYNNKNISIRMRAPAEPGIYYYCINRINYRIGEKYLSAEINKIVTVNVLKMPPNITIQTDGADLRVFADDPGATLRHFSLCVTCAGYVYCETYSIADNVLYLNNLNPDQAYHVKLSLVFHTGNFRCRDIVLFEADIQGENSLKIGEIEIMEKADTLRNFIIRVKSGNYLKRLSVNGVGLDVKSPRPIAQKIIISLVSLSVTGGAAYLIKRHIIKKRKEKSSAHESGE